MTLLKSYLSNRSQITKLGENSSSKLNINIGVPQESILGPILFILYINDIHKCLDISDDRNLILFADGSDHLPILIYIECQVSSLKPILTKELRWNWNKADFNGFSVYVEDAMKEISNDIAAASMDARMNFLNAIIIEATYKFVGKVKYSTNDKYGLLVRLELL